MSIKKMLNSKKIKSNQKNDLQGYYWDGKQSWLLYRTAEGKCFKIKA